MVRPLGAGRRPAVIEAKDEVTETRRSPDPSQPLLPAADRVLSTLNPDGSRRWLDPRLSRGRFLRARRAVAWLLLVLFTATPFLRVNGKPVLLLDVAAREFTVFGTTLLPTDTLLLALLLLVVFVTIFLLTALFGRVWCGWACPQTVYMEFVYRPIERLFRKKSGATSAASQVGKYAVYLLVSFVVANTFLAYFVGSDRLLEWMTGSPADHPGAFLIMAVVTALMLLDFAYAREQVCTLMCPYGRFQSVMLDRDSLIIGYDTARGEPRGPLRKREEPRERGDCVDCHLCVRTCPTGIDIRDGLQMECIGCAQCIDACDEVMDKIGRPRGLIRYSSQNAMETGARRLLRPRVVIYPVVLVLLLTALFFAAKDRARVDLTFLRTRTTPYTVRDDGRVQNQVRVKLTNRGEEPRRYRLSLAGDGELICPQQSIVLPPGDSASEGIFVILPRDRFERGRAAITLVVTDEVGTVERFEHHVLGPLFGTATPTPEAGR